jgi:hypothetical protein
MFHWPTEILVHASERSNDPKAFMNTGKMTFGRNLQRRQWSPITPPVTIRRRGPVL